MHEAAGVTLAIPVINGQSIWSPLAFGFDSGEEGAIGRVPIFNIFPAVIMAIIAINVVAPNAKNILNLFK